MNVKTRSSLAWLVLGMSLILTSWVIYDVVQRYRNLLGNDQELYFADSTISAVDNDEILLEDVVSSHLFGVQPTVEKVTKPKVVDAPKTRLNLKLTGMVSASNSEFGFAMIEIKRGETSVVGVGKEIGKTGAKLYSIESNHILIDHNGKIEKLQLERDILGISDSDSLSSETVKTLDLSAAELAALTEIGDSEPIENEQYSDQSSQYSDQSFIEAELGVQEIEEEVEDDPDEVDEQEDQDLQPLEEVPEKLNQI